MPRSSAVNYHYRHVLGANLKLSKLTIALPEPPGRIRGAERFTFLFTMKQWSPLSFINSLRRTSREPHKISHPTGAGSRESRYHTIQWCTLLHSPVGISSFMPFFVFRTRPGRRGDISRSDFAYAASDWRFSSAIAPIKSERYKNDPAPAVVVTLLNS